MTTENSNLSEWPIMLLFEIINAIHFYVFSFFTLHYIKSRACLKNIFNNFRLKLEQILVPRII